MARARRPAPPVAPAGSAQSRPGRPKRCRAGPLAPHHQRGRGYPAQVVRSNPWNTPEPRRRHQGEWRDQHAYLCPGARGGDQVPARGHQQVDQIGVAARVAFSARDARTAAPIRAGWHQPRQQLSQPGDGGQPEHQRRARLGHPGRTDQHQPVDPVRVRHCAYHSAHRAPPEWPSSAAASNSRASSRLSSHATASCGSDFVGGRSGRSAPARARSGAIARTPPSSVSNGKKNPPEFRCRRGGALAAARC